MNNNIRGDKMDKHDGQNSTTRREHLKRLMGVAAVGAYPMVGAPTANAASEPAIPQNGMGHRIRHLSYSDQGGRPDGVQVMYNRQHIYVGHMFSDGVTVLDARDPRNLKPVHFFTAGSGTRTHQLQTSGDYMLLANGANIVSMQSYDGLRGYFENNPVDTLTNRKKFRSGMSIHDISKPGSMPEIAFLEIPGIGVNRIAWQGGRYAYVASHADGFTDTILFVIDLKDITKPEIVAKWWLPGMNRGAGEISNQPKGKRYALHHLLPYGPDMGIGAWRDGGITVHDLKDPTNPKLMARLNWSPPFPGGTHTPLGLPGRQLAVIADEANAQKCAKGTFHSFVVDMRSPNNPATIATLPTPRDRDYCASPGTFGPHNLHENRPDSFQSEDTIFATYNNAGVRIFDIKDQFSPQEVAYWVPPVPKRLIDPRPNIALDAKTADLFVTKEGLIFVSDWNAGLNVLEYKG
jgi:hypothetical protein